VSIQSCGFLNRIRNRGRHRHPLSMIEGSKTITNTRRRGDQSEPSPRLVQPLQQPRADDNAGRQLGPVHFGANQNPFAIRANGRDIHRLIS
jgi:hypothetical protein